MMKAKHPLWGFIKKHYLIMALALILLVEVVWSGIIVISSKNAASQIPMVRYAPADTKINGVIFYETGRSAAVDDQLLEDLAQLRSTGVNTILLPVDFLGHMNGSTIDGAWLGQVATVMEMIFQSNCRVILGVTAFDSSAISAADYADLWLQIDAAFGHRPASELGYEIYIPAGEYLADFELKLLSTISDIRKNNGQREILLLPDKVITEEQRDEFVSTFAQIGVNIGLYANDEMDKEFLYLYGLQNQLAASNNMVVIVGDEGSIGDEALTSLIQTLAEQGGMSYLLQAN